MKKVIKDFKCYLDEIEKLSRSLSKLQKKELETLISSLLTFLVCLKLHSKLGEVYFDWENKWIK